MREITFGEAAAAVLNDRRSLDDPVYSYTNTGGGVMCVVYDADNLAVTFGNANDVLGYSTEDGRSGESTIRTKLYSRAWCSATLVMAVDWIEQAVTELTTRTYDMPANVQIKVNGHGQVTSVTVIPHEGSPGWFGYRIPDEVNVALSDYLTSVTNGDTYDLSWEG